MSGDFGFTEFYDVSNVDRSQLSGAGLLNRPSNERLGITPDGEVVRISSDLRNNPRLSASSDRPLYLRRDVSHLDNPESDLGLDDDGLSAQCPCHKVVIIKKRCHLRPARGVGLVDAESEYAFIPPRRVDSGLEVRPDSYQADGSVAYRLRQRPDLSAQPPVTSEPPPQTTITPLTSGSAVTPRPTVPSRPQVLNVPTSQQTQPVTTPRFTSELDGSIIDTSSVEPFDQDYIRETKWSGTQDTPVRTALEMDDLLADGQITEGFHRGWPHFRRRFRPRYHRPFYRRPFRHPYRFPFYKYPRHPHFW